MKLKYLASIAEIVMAAVLLSACGAVPQPQTALILPTSNPLSQPGAAYPAAQSRAFVGVVSAISADQWTIGGLPFNANSATAIKNQLALGQRARAHVMVNTDGSFTLISVETAPAQAVTGWNDDSGASSSADDESGSISSLSDSSSSSSGSSSSSASSSGSSSSAESSGSSSSSHSHEGQGSGGDDKGAGSGKHRHGGGSGGKDGSGGGTDSSGH